MPAPQASIIRSAAILKFQSFQIQLPAVQAGMGGASTHLPAVQRPAATFASRTPASGIARGASSSPPQQQTGQPMSMPPALFKAASNNLQDVEYQRQMHDKYNKLFDGLSNGIAAAWSQFHSSATLAGVTINAIAATGGRVVCPALETFVFASSEAAGSGQWESKIREQTGKAFWTCWKQMLDSIRVPGLPWYPLFAAVPSPVAPPTPNVPTPIITLISNQGAMGTSNLKSNLISFLQGKMDYHTQFSEALAVGIDAAFQLWKASTMVTNVLGTGPVPSFAPPYVPVGPVVGGTANMTPGGFV